MKEVIDLFASSIISDRKLIAEDDGTRKTLKWEVVFIDQSRLIAYESTASYRGRSKYNYQWMTTNHDLIVRWDNNLHYGHIATYPHHQHIGSDENVQPSEPMTLEKVLTFISEHLHAD